jgi:hypothetical protein
MFGYFVANVMILHHGYYNFNIEAIHNNNQTGGLLSFGGLLVKLLKQGTKPASATFLLANNRNSKAWNSLIQKALADGSINTNLEKNALTLLYINITSIRLQSLTLRKECSTLVVLIPILGT